MQKMFTKEKSKVDSTLVAEELKKDLIYHLDYANDQYISLNRVLESQSHNAFIDFDYIKQMIKETETRIELLTQLLQLFQENKEL